MGYWDLEEGKDCVGKTWITTKMGTVLGLVGSAYHLVLIQPETSLEALTRAANGTVTMGSDPFSAAITAVYLGGTEDGREECASLGAIFGVTTCLSAHVRDAPDDPTNYFLGGCASGAFLGARTHSVIIGTTACLGLGIVAMLTKVGKKEGWRLSGEPRL